MDLATITMDRAQARAAFLDYRRSVRERHDAEDEQIMRGYRELSRGRHLIHLSDTIRRGGSKYVQSNGQKRWLPALAVMRADQRECWLERPANGTVVYTPERWYRGRRDRIRVDEVVVDRDLTSFAADWRAMVPPVPPVLRPKHHMRNYHILWEAEWSYQALLTAPGDPALLKRIGGDLFVVLATWELTELERAVLGGRV